MNLFESKNTLFEKLQIDINNNRLINAMHSVPREKFVMPEDFSKSYDDVALSIEFNQSISQPSIIAMMLDSLNISKFENVLEIGTGSGYQAAILSNLSDKVTTTECVTGLYNVAQERLIELGFSTTSVLNVEVGEWGSELNAPYDAIVVSAACPSIPKKLIDQLSKFGRMVVPVGGPSGQELILIHKSPSGMAVQTIANCKFVPLKFNANMF